MYIKGVILDENNNIVGKLLPIINCTQCLYFIKEKRMIGCEKYKNSTIITNSEDKNDLMNGVGYLMQYCGLQDYTYEEYHNDKSL